MLNALPAPKNAGILFGKYPCAPCGPKELFWKSIRKESKKKEVTTLLLLLALATTLWIAAKAAAAAWEAVARRIKKLDSREAKAVRVIDGDSLLVRPEGSNQTIEVRVRGIDAPEIGQHGGHGAKILLKALVEGEGVEISNLETDRYGRTIADVTHQDECLAEELVERGAAWAARRYTSGSKEAELEAAEEKAREEKKGIWKNPEKNTKPWEFRKQKAEGARQTPLGRGKEPTLDDFR